MSYVRPLFEKMNPTPKTDVLQALLEARLGSDQINALDAWRDTLDHARSLEDLLTTITDELLVAKGQVMEEICNEISKDCLGLI